MTLSKEQQYAVDVALEGDDIFIDAVIGSGKTTVLNEIAKNLKDKVILYLTYNKLLKEDAKSKINLKNIEIHNYHGFVYKYLLRAGLSYTNTNGIRDFVALVENKRLKVQQYDVILVDEYQDIDDDSASLLKTIISNQNKKPQLIFVGDMKQKIYDKTRINVLDDVIFQLSNDYTKIDFTFCFRISPNHAKMLGNIWNKRIIGVNDDQVISYINENQLNVLEEKLNNTPNKDILILTPFRNNVKLSQFINYLEKTNPKKYNKENLYVTIQDKDDQNKAEKNSMIVTTYDGSKGLERKLCIVWGWNENTLQYRSSNGKKEIIKNLYLVAASRGKEEIIFIQDNNNLLNENNFNRNLYDREISEKFKISDMFDFKFESDIRKCFNLLDIKEIPQDDESEIIVKSTDYNINLSPVIGIYQEAIFFNSWKYEIALSHYDQEKPVVKYVRKIEPKKIEKQVLCLVACETDLTRYATQAITTFIDTDEKEKLMQRISTHLDRTTPTQKWLNIKYRKTDFIGRIDAEKNGIIYELKFVRELELKHYLQIAMYILMANKEVGILWNTRFNKMYEIRIKDKDSFIYNVYKTVRKE